MTGNPPQWEPPMPYSGLYILRYRKPILCDGMRDWGKRSVYSNPKVRKTYVGDTMISTVFLGVDCGQHIKENHEPILFETMIFPYPDDYQTRCSTWRQALKMHWDAVREVKRDCRKT